MRTKNRLTLCMASFLLLVGCSESNDTTKVPASGPVTLHIVGADPDLILDGERVTLMAARGFDGAGIEIGGPFEVVYDGDMSFPEMPAGTASVDLEFQRAQGYILAHQTVTVPPGHDSEILLSGLLPSKQATLRKTFTVRIVNNSGYNDSVVYVMVSGLNAEQKAYHYLQFDSEAVGTSHVFGPVSDYAKYSQPLTSLRKESGAHAYSFQCPFDKLIAGRIWLSFKGRLQGVGLNDVTNPLTFVQPSATGAPDYQTVYEFLELSATSDASSLYTLFTNTSVVDFFSLGLNMTMSYQDDKNDKAEATVGFMDNARANILRDIKDTTKVPAEFQTMVMKTGTTDVLRLLSPNMKVSLDSTGPLSIFLTESIKQGWDHYTTVPLNIPDTLAPNYHFKWTGTKIDPAFGTLDMTCTDAISEPPPASLGEICHLPKPTTRIVFACDDAPAQPIRNTWSNAGTDGHKRLCSLLSAALNRGVFENYSDWAKPNAYYTRIDKKYNHYAKILKEYALNHKVYGFGYDDIYGQDPSVNKPIPKVNQVTITIPAVPEI